MKALAPLITAAVVAAGLPGPLAAEPDAHGQGDMQAERVIGGVIDTLIGNSYNGGDRQAIRRCAFAAVDKAERQYRPYFGNRPFAYPGYRGHVRVTAITDVQRRTLVTRVRGLMSTARHGYGHGTRGSDLSFRCDVNHRGYVSDVRVERNAYWRR